MDALDEVEKMWGLSSESPHKLTNPKDLCNLTSQALNVSTSDKIETLQDKFQTHISSIIEMLNNLKNDNCDFETIVRVNRVLEMSYYACNTFIGLVRMSEIMDHANDYRDNTDANLFRFRAIDTAENTKYQNFLLYILGVFYKNNYARYNGEVYQTIFSKTNDKSGKMQIYNTCAWQRVGSISDIIYKHVSKETNYDQFLNITSRSDAVRSAQEFLSQCIDSQFPALERDRHVFSFTNGLYIADNEINGKFVAYNSKEYNKYKHIVSAKYFDIEYNETYASCDWRTIETPVFDSIFHHQQIPQDVMKWVYALTGRLIYNIDELDGWQVILFIQGQAGTGKSTYVNNVCKELYEEEDVGIMSNNIQTKFGLSDIVDKLVYVAPEIKRDFSIEQGEFQSIVSGEKVTINVKFKQSRFENWKAPGVLAGNECPDFIDNAGSIQRRMVTVRFTEKVRNGDLQLGKKLKKEMGALISKCNAAYREIALMHGRENIWTLLPQYFTDTQQELARSTNPLIHFLLSELVSLDPKKCIPEKIFVQAFNDHCKENNYAKHRFNPDFYMGPFAQYGIKVERNCRKFYNGQNRNGTFYVGVDLADLDIAMDFNEDHNSDL
jgi:phage/plasmid-associated DNA primase